MALDSNRVAYIKGEDEKVADLCVIRRCGTFSGENGTSLAGSTGRKDFFLLTIKYWDVFESKLYVAGYVWVHKDLTVCDFIYGYFVKYLLHLTARDDMKEPSTTKAYHFPAMENGHIRKELKRIYKSSLSLRTLCEQLARDYKKKEADIMGFVVLGRHSQITSGDI